VARQAKTSAAPELQKRMTGPGATPVSEPATGASEQAQATQRPVEQRSDPKQTQRLEREGQERVAGVLLTDPGAACRVHPLCDALSAAVAQLFQQGLVFRVAQTHVPPGQRDD